LFHLSRAKKKKKKKQNPNQFGKETTIAKHKTWECAIQPVLQLADAKALAWDPSNL
jgi:hypothetical protein